MPDQPPNRRLNWRFPPLPDKPQPFPTKPPLEAGMADLVGLTLVVSCESCKRRGLGHLPCRLLAAAFGWSLPLHRVIQRLRCSQCQQPPDSVLLVDRPDRMQEGTYGPGAGAKVLRLI